MPTKQRNQHILLPIILVLLIATILCAGCMEASLHTEVKPDGTVSEYSGVVKTSNLFRSQVDQRVSDLKSFEETKTFTIDVVNKGNDVVVTFKNKKPLTGILLEREKMSTILDDDTVTFRQYAGVSSVIFAGGTVTYTLKMPGKIVYSNADEVKGDTAFWFFRNGQPEEIWATSNVSGFPFGLLAILLVICAAVGFFFWRRS
jgi:hypothetical protein